MLTLENLSFAYTREGLFRDLDLVLEPGMIYGLLGKNGAGKTSLLRLISGQLFPSGGNLEVLGFDPRLRQPGMLRDIYFLPEEFPVPRLTGTRYLALNSPFYPRFDRERFLELCDGFQIDPAWSLSQVSLGQKKKFLLAFGLASGVRLLILDEPTNGLDIPSKRQFRRLAASSLGEDQTILISTHQVRDMENLIDPVVILDSGHILFTGTIDSIARKFRMSLETSEPLPSDAFYFEKVPGGYSVVRMNHEGDESHVDLEVFFNMVIERGEDVAGILQSGREDRV
ncbi:ABC transporter ATP-binding protein [Marispirochaeta sp.]|uniref:ABC transporter ATP-binding protein n=1 Tax=Marispirochaeta sp. TaxID=2038653 RepID=UPI0029C86573|nr:ABC transporter ATP-binding protein [Marispirochaeta sp.]